MVRSYGASKRRRRVRLRGSVVNAAAASLGLLRTIVDHSAAAQPTGGGYGLKNGLTEARTAI